MELRQFEYVLAVVDTGGFTRAAHALAVTQPSLSQGIRTLERELGVELFHRLGRTVTLTSAGEAFVGPARETVHAAAAARDAVAAVTEVLTGTLDLVALPTLAAEPLAPLVGRFRGAYPGVRVRVAEPEDGVEVAALVRSGRAEVGLADAGAGGDDLVAYPLLTQEILAVGPPGTHWPRAGVSIAEIVASPLVATPPGTSTRRLLDEAVTAAGVEPVLAVELSQRDAIVPLVLAGAGHALLPAPLADDAAARGAVIARLDPPITRVIALLHRSGTLSPAAHAFLRVATADT
jgi:DNA-binding transcriptional LysR family regulator